MKGLESWWIAKTITISRVVNQSKVNYKQNCRKVWKVFKVLQHSMLKLDANTKKRYDRWKTLQIKKNSIKQVFFIKWKFFSGVTTATQKKSSFFFTFFLGFLRFSDFFKISNFQNIFKIIKSALFFISEQLK